MAHADPVHGYEAEQWGGWYWRDPSHGEHYRTCSYCGCINPVDLAAEPEWTASWADWKYGFPHKWYADIVNRTPEQRYIFTACHGDRPRNFLTGHEDDRWIRASDIPEDVNTEGWRDIEHDYDWVQLGTRAHHHAKFYTRHFADPALLPTIAEDLMRRSGLRIEFTGTTITWEAWTQR